MIIEILFTVIVAVIVFLLITEKFDKTLLVLSGSILIILLIRYSLKRDLDVVYSSLINWHTIALIVGMTILVENLNRVNFFDYWSVKVVIWSKLEPVYLFVFLGVFTLLLSAFLDNVSAIILLGSLTIVLSERLGINPLPVILYQGFITGIGGIMTSVGSVPTIIINQNAGFPFFYFLGIMFIITIVCFIVTTLYFYSKFKTDIAKEIPEELKQIYLNIDPDSILKDKSILIKGNLLIIGLLLGFIFSENIGMKVDFIAMGFGIISIILFNFKPSNIWHEVNWDMLFFFIGLFIVIGGLELSGALEILVNILEILIQNYPILAILVLIFVVGIFSALLDSIPIALIIGSTLAKVNEEMINLHGVHISNVIWLSAIFATNIGGGLAPIGSVTIIMALEILREHKIEIKMMEYVKLIFPLFMLLSTLGFLYFWILYLLV